MSSYNSVDWVFIESDSLGENDTSWYYDKKRKVVISVASPTDEQKELYEVIE